MSGPQSLKIEFLAMSIVVILSTGAPARFVFAAATPTPPQLAVDEIPVIYPQEAYDAKQEGSVKLGFVIKEDGTPTNIKVLEATRPESLKKEAIGFVNFSHYTPAVVDGRKQPAAGLTRTIDFKLATALLGPKPISRPKPLWPAHVAWLISGFCDIDFMVETDGSVSKAEVISSGPNQLFDETCLNTVRSWTFQPAMRRGEPVAAPQFYHFHFIGHDTASTYMGPGQWVTLRYTLRRDGTPIDLEVVGQSDPDVFVGKARRQLLHMHFKPAME